jgi:hypothetical protein
MFYPLPNMYWSRKATFEWSEVRGEDAQAANGLVAGSKWHDCIPRTCKTLGDLWSRSFCPRIALEIMVDDQFLHTEAYVVKQALAGQYLVLEKKDDAAYNIAVRPLLRKLLYAEHDMEKNLIRLCSMMTGESQDDVPFDKYKDYTWLNFEKKIAERMSLSPGRVVLFPSHVTDMSELIDWKENPQRHSRLLVKTGLDPGEQSEAIKRPAASTRVAASSSSSSPLKRPAASSSSSSLKRPAASSSSSCP